MKNKLKILSVLVIATLMMTGCMNEADRVSSNISKEADNFNTLRELTVINNMTDKVVFQMTGYLSIYADTTDNQLEITVKEEKDKYKKHFVGLSQFTTYVIEDVTGADVSTSKYTLNFNPDMLLPIDIKNRNSDNSK